MKKALKNKGPVVALCMIAKDEEERIAKAIESVGIGVDMVILTDTGSTDKTVKVAQAACKKLGVKFVSEVGDFTDVKLGEFNFADARQSNLELARKSGATWIFWIDADDTVTGADLLKMHATIAEANGGTSVDMVYQYTIQAGRTITNVWRTRLFRADLYDWEPLYLAKRGIRYPIHENLYPVDLNEYLRPIDPGRDVPSKTTEISIQHHATKLDMKNSSDRNIRILKKLEEFEGDDPDPRTIFLIGRQLFERKEWHLAVDYLREYMRYPNNPGDRLHSMFIIAQCYEAWSKYDKMLGMGMMMLKEFPRSKEPYVVIARAHLFIGDYDLAIEYAEKCLNTSEPENNMIKTTFQLDKEAGLIIADSLAKIGNLNGQGVYYKRAAETLSVFMDTALDDAERTNFNEQMDKYKSRKAAMDVLDAWDKVLDAKLLFAKTDEEKAQAFVDMFNVLPKNPIRTHWRIEDKRRAFGVYNVYKKPHVTIYCTANFEQWSPETIVKKGAGGSETAVIEQAKRFVQWGYGVTVYANPPEEGMYDGVEYLHASKIDFSTVFDIFISWRNVDVYHDRKVMANKRFIWLQDIMEASDYPKEIWEDLDGIIVLSTYHRAYLEQVPESKFFYTTNGINLDLIKEVEKQKIKRDPNMVIYASSADRGLEPLIFEIWPEVLRRVKNPEEKKLVWYYGWNSTLGLSDPDSDGGKKVRKWIKKMDHQMEKIGVINGGRIGKKELYAEYFKSNIWLYPLQGPAETSCITAMEAQACGAYPITTGITALAETQQFGIKQKNRELLIQSIVRVLEGDYYTGDGTGDIDRYRTEMMGWARSTFDWDRVAKQWVDEIFYGDMRKPLAS